MKTSFLAVQFAVLALALPEPEGHEFRAPGPFDSRSPCPGLNALANHNWLRHDGKNLDWPMINTAAQDAYGFGPGMYKPFVDMVFQFNISTTNTPNETFNLFDLARHDTIEVDGSLTRNDIYFGDDVHFDASVFAPVAQDLGLNQNLSAHSFVTTETAALATKNRLALAKRVNPAFNASASQHESEYGTTALYLYTLLDEDSGTTPKPWVKAFLGEDRIAYSEGYSKGSSVKTQEQLDAMLDALLSLATAQLYLNVTALGAADGASTIECWQVKSPFAVATDAGTPGSAIAQLGNIANMSYLAIPPNFDGGLHRALAKQWVYMTSGLAYTTVPGNNSAGAYMTGGEFGLIFAADTADVSTEGHRTQYHSNTQTIGIQLPTLNGETPAHDVLHSGPCVTGEVSGLRSLV
ncbi:Uu.00g137960.m01.CDS01 [Anthostomella pinea]|uniref:Uu.00g137960.m01.CDS01 n=1 Tax=Anthostomella pinea TaxID=933095 RepID=A0AAI8VJ69_9PEZI|nr:Uu.00g137960.m01.CDS01 [Anthostomella pinea]